MKQLHIFFTLTCFAATPSFAQRVTYAVMTDDGKAAGTIVIAHADMLAEKADAVVNAANEGCLGGAGIDGAIHAQAGTKLRAFNSKLPESTPGNRCPTGEARISPAFKLAPFTYIIATTGPLGSDSNRETLIKNSYRSSLDLARTLNNPSGALLKENVQLLRTTLGKTLKSDTLSPIRTISFPLISGKIFGYPAQNSHKPVIETVITYMKQYPDAFQEVRFYFWDPAEQHLAQRDFAIYQAYLDALFHEISLAQLNQKLNLLALLATD